MPTREEIYSALFRLGSSVLDAGGSPYFKTSGRRWQPWSEVAIEAMPALFQKQVGEDVTTNQSGIPVRWMLHAEWWVYTGVGADENLSPAELINPVVDALLESLRPAAGLERQTLGGLVQHAHVGARIETSEGFLGEKEVVIIPVEIFTAEL